MALVAPLDRAVLTPLACRGEVEADEVLADPSRWLAWMPAVPELRITCHRTPDLVMVSTDELAPSPRHLTAEDALAALDAGARALWLGVGPHSEVRLGLDVTRVEDARLPEVLGADEGVAWRWEHLRGHAHEWEVNEVRSALAAAALVQWHVAARFCGWCAGENEVIAGGWEVRCRKCGRHDYPRQDPAVIMLVLDAEDRLLLAHNRAWEAGRVSLLAGFMEAGEAPARTVVREVAEEVGLRVGEVEYLTAQPWPFPRSLMLAHRCRLMPGEEAVPKPDGVEITQARFYSREDLVHAVESGEVTLPGPSAIASALIAQWFGGPLPAPHPQGR